VSNLRGVVVIEDRANADQANALAFYDFRSEYLREEPGIDVVSEVPQSGLMFKCFVVMQSHRS
jgi:hypothetical protein